MITQDMLDELNNELSDSIIMLKLRDDHVVDFVLRNTRRVDSYIINLEDETHEMVQKYFKDKGIEIMYNNTCSCFWARHPY